MNKSNPTIVTEDKRTGVQKIVSSITFYQVFSLVLQFLFVAE